MSSDRIKCEACGVTRVVFDPPLEIDVEEWPPDRVFLLSQHLFGETKAGPFVFASHEGARRYAAETYGTTDRGWWKQSDGHWTKHVKRRIVLPWNGGEFIEDAYLTIREHEVMT